VISHPMRVLFFSFVTCILLLGSSVPAEEIASDEPAGSGVTVLIYHRFGENKYPSTNIALDRFSEQLDFLRNNNYQVIPLEQLVHSLEGKSKLPERAVVITIDDGYRSVYTDAWPALKQYGYPFTVFVYAKATENKHWNYMTWNQIKEMKAAGVDFQNHGFAHDHMAFKPPEMNMDEYKAWMRADLAVSTRILSEELNERPRFFALPYGEYNKTVLDEIRSFGYEAIFLQDPGSVSKETDPFAIPREPILGNEWATMQHFQKVLERVNLPISGEIPASGQLLDKAPNLFGAKLLYPDRYIPGTLGIYVSELGWQRATLEGDFVKISNSSILNRRINRVVISGREKESGRTAIRYWMVVGEIENLKN
jgi:peptidoglycan/xylan/chitin deacetylase (PgdA/CDA1 family)